MLFQTCATKTKWQAVQIDAKEKVSFAKSVFRSNEKENFVALGVFVSSLFGTQEVWETKYKPRKVFPFLRMTNWLGKYNWVMA